MIAAGGSGEIDVQSFAIEGETNPQDVRVWYPALNSEGAAESTTYVISWEKYQLDSSSKITGHALVDAVLDLNAAPYPLVMFSQVGRRRYLLYLVG